MKTRLATAEDYDLILRLCREAAEQMRSKGIDHWQYWLAPPPDKLSWVAEGLALQQYHFVYQEQELIGMYRLQYSDEMYWGHQEVAAGYVHALVVRPECKGQGWGPRFLAHIKAQLQAEGIQLIRLDCNGANQFLCDYYRQQGFTKVGEKQMPYSLNFLYEQKLTASSGAA